MDISIIIPAFNEQPSLEELCARIREAVTPKSWAYEVIVVDDGSSDGTIDTVKNIQSSDPNIHGIRFRTNYGKAAALSAGFARAQGTYVITMDGDLQDDPNEIPELIAKLEEGYDLVSGWKKKRHDPISKRFPSKFFNLMLSVVSGIRLHDFNCGLKAYRNAVVKSFRLYGQLHRYLPALAHWMGFRVTEKVVTHHARKHGKSKYGAGRFVHGYLDMITIVFLHKYMKRPLHLFGVWGSLFVLAGMGVLGYFGVQWVITGHMHIRPLTLLAVTSMILGIQFISIGLLGEMITYSGRRDEAQIADEI